MKIIEFFNLIDSYCCEWIKWQWNFIDGNECEGENVERDDTESVDDKNRALSPIVFNHKWI